MEKLIIAIMYSDEEVYDKCKNDLVEKYGEID